ncbi:TonB-dependent receptor [Croceicoccus sp. F390]|uniref:TonB-dependent receptor n=1 Tax=Croceicoccus esteveae TaxID=3075597 RepID=A0ABU2ZFM8_9SPHN|nr:TonB-dependent receptor [Croceicoccus sp. F390]MDT0575161.1 TonB-dependent receptor [Croceicoccus sp. F390]
MRSSPAVRFGLRSSTALRAVAVVALGLSATTAAQAQVVPDASDQVTNPTPPFDNAIIVTGSRISNPNLEQSSPVAVVTSDELELQQTVVVEDVIREIPGVVPSLGAQVNNGNGGNTFVNLRGIGENRNITLLNGTRVVPAGLDGITNIDVIPVALLQRTDVLTGGAGATYGADAISGVINFITRDDFSGMEASATQQITEKGDGNIFRADLLLGANFDDDRGNAVFSIGYTNRDAVTQGDRAFGRENISSTTGQAGGSSTTVPSVITVPGTTGGTLQVAPDGNSLTPYYGPYNFNPLNLYQLPIKQYRMYGAARYEISDAIEVFGESLFVQSTTQTEIAPSGTFRNVLTTPLSNPFLNAGIRNQICGLDTDAEAAGVQPLFSQAECNAAAVATDPDDEDYRTVGLDYGRRFVEFGPRVSEYETQLFQIKGGARGELTSALNWEMFGAYGESENTQRQSGNGTFTRLQQAVLATNPDTCLDTTNACVPINLFGPAGSISQDVRDFLDVGNSGATKTSLGQFQAFVSGDLGAVSPGSDLPLGVAGGFEYRKYTAESVSDLLSQTPGEVLGNGAASPDVSGEYDVYEFFGEIAAPILSDVAFFEELLLEAGARYSHYSTTGNEFTWKAGGSWTPVEGFQVRGNYQQVTRAPNIGELFDVPTTGLDNFTVDPCAGAAPLTSDALRATCLAQGAPVTSIGSIQVDPAGQVNVTTGGNLNLSSEDATVWTAGVVLRPDFFRGFTATVDYYNIVVTNAITNPTIGDVLGACFGPELNGTGSASDPACTSIRRNPATGNLFGSVGTTPGLPLVLTNQGRIETDGIDVVMNYGQEFGAFNLNLNFQGNWTNRSRFNANENDPESLNRECVGFYSINCSSIQPEFSFNQRTTLGFGDVDVSLLWRFIDGVKVEPLVNQPNAAGVRPFPIEDFTSIGSEHYFDLSIRAQVLENFTIIATAINMLDNKPKVVGSTIGSTAYNSGNIYPSTYDPLGRRYGVTAKVTF